MGSTMNVVFVGITVVFLALIILSLIIYASGKFFSAKNNTRNVKEIDNNEASVLEIDEDEKIDAPYNNLSNDELVAVLTAAIQASMRSRPECNIRVKSFRRIPQSSPVWNVTGRNEQLAGKL